MKASIQEKGPLIGGENMSFAYMLHCCNITGDHLELLSYVQIRHKHTITLIV